MATILHLTPEQSLLASLFIAYHDTVIEYDEADPNNIVGTIRRHRGAREDDNPPYGSNGNEG